MRKLLPIRSPFHVRGDLDSHRSRLGLLTLAFLVGFLTIGVVTAIWSVVRAPAILPRNDNPRLVEAELQIQRGRILDVNNVVLAESVGVSGDFVRRYATSSSGPAVGYYSFRHGTAGIEEGFDRLLRGEIDDYWKAFWQRDTLHEPPVGQDIRLTLNAEWQRVAEVLMGDFQGAVVLVSIPDVEIRAMVSHPGFDPNMLDQQFETLVTDEKAPLLNRATQGLYQPGLAIQPLVLAAALASGATEPFELLEDATKPVLVNGNVMTCEAEEVDVETWADALTGRCPAPFAELARLLGESDFLEIYRMFGLLSVPDLPIRAEVADFQPIENIEQAGIGQDTLTVSPMQMAMALTAVANDGTLRQPKLVLAIQSEEDQWLPAGKSQGGQVAVSSQIAQTVRELLPQYDGIREYAATALSGPQGNATSWYLGFAPVGDPRFAVVVVVENDDDTTQAEQVGRSLLNQSLGRR